MAHVGKLYERLQGAQDLALPIATGMYPSRRLITQAATFTGTENTGWSNPAVSEEGIRFPSNPVLTYYFPPPPGANPNTAFEIAIELRFVSGLWRHYAANRVFLNGVWTAYGSSWQPVFNGTTWLFNQLMGIGITDGSESFGILVTPRAMQWID